MNAASPSASKARAKLSSAQALDASLTQGEELLQDESNLVTAGCNFVLDDSPPTVEEIKQLASIIDFMRGDAGDTPATGGGKLTAPAADLDTLAEVMASRKLSDNAKCVRLNDAVAEICSRIWVRFKSYKITRAAFFKLALFILAPLKASFSANGDVCFWEFEKD